MGEWLSAREAFHCWQDLRLSSLLAVPAAVEAQSDCSEYISGGPGNPINGTLIGTQLRTETITVSEGVSGSAGVVGGNAGGSRTVTVSYYVGIYRMSNRDIYEVRCDNYTLM